MRIDPIHHLVADTNVVHSGKPGHPPSDRTDPRPHQPRNHSPPLDNGPASGKPILTTSPVGPLAPSPPEARAKCGAGGTFVKRIVGRPGERLRIRLAGGAAFVYVNGRKLEEPYIEHDR